MVHSSEIPRNWKIFALALTQKAGQSNERWIIWPAKMMWLKSLLKIIPVWWRAFVLQVSCLIYYYLENLCNLFHKIKRVLSISFWNLNEFWNSWLTVLKHNAFRPSFSSSLDGRLSALPSLIFYESRQKVDCLKSMRCPFFWRQCNDFFNLFPAKI